MKSALSFIKFLEILNENSINLDKVFVCGNEIIYLHVEYKNCDFFIYIPDNYRMLIKKDIPYVNITRSDMANELTANFLQLLSERLDYTMLVISNNYIFTTDDQSFKITGKIQIHNNDVGLVDLLEKQSRELTKNISIKFSDTTDDYSEDEENNVNPQGSPTELEFYDHDGEMIPKKSHYASLVTEEEEEIVS